MFFRAENNSFLRWLCVVFSMLLFPPNVFGIQPLSRYFPFSNAPQSRLLEGGNFFSSETFLVTADSAWDHSENSVGISGLWGDYNLRDIAHSMQLFRRESGAGLYQIQTAPNLVNGDYKVAGDIKFQVDTEMDAVGVKFGYAYGFPGDFLSFNRKGRGWDLLKNVRLFAGVDVPAMRIRTSSKYDFDQKNSWGNLANISDTELLAINDLRKEIHSALGISDNVWIESGLGDIDCFVGAKFHRDRILRFRSIDLSLALGVNCPSGKPRSEKHVSSIPFGSDRFIFYIESLAHFELKRTLAAGCSTGFFLPTGYGSRRVQRVPIFDEPPVFSPLAIDLKKSLGAGFKFEPYIVLKNFIGGLNATLSYSYMWHWKDSLKDERDFSSNSNLAHSLLTRSPSVDHNISDVGVGDSRLKNVKDEYERSSELSMRQIRASLVYAWKNKKLDTKFSASYIHPLGGHNVVKGRMWTLGLTVNF